MVVRREFGMKDELRDRLNGSLSQSRVTEIQKNKFQIPITAKTNN